MTLEEAIQKMRETDMPIKHDNINDDGHMQMYLSDYYINSNKWEILE